MRARIPESPTHRFDYMFVSFVRSLGVTAGLRRAGVLQEERSSACGDREICSLVVLCR